jgi:tetratricopeptide (TPR) repeat protein
MLLLAESQLALDQPDQAIETLVECLEGFPNHPTSYQARLVAAQAYAERGLLSDAKQLLAANVDSDDLSPRSSQWRDSLFLMGKLLHREGLEHEAKSRAAGVDGDDQQRTREALLELEPAHAAFITAIDKLGRAVERYPEAPQTREARYLLADCYRQASKWPRKKMKLVAIEATRSALARQSQLDLDNAVLEYDRLITELGDVQDSLNHSALEKQVLRNSYFSKADALFDLGRYEDAIRAYSAASNRYQNEPESLGAYVQIAACYRLLNRPQEARGTLQQAQGVLLRMKPDAKFTAATPYTRDEWGTLLKWLGTL